MDEALDLAAAEYLLGTLAPAERAAFMARLARDPAAADAVRAWAERLAPLDEALPELAPPATLWPRIEGRLAPANDRRVARGWRAGAIAASIVAVAASGIAMRQASAPPETRAVAALSADGATPALLVTWHPKTHRYEVLPVAMPPRAGRAMQLWLIVGDAPPKPLGMVPERHGWTQAAAEPDGPATIAVSIEPIGGSPTGRPTGPVVMTGKLMGLPGET